MSFAAEPLAALLQALDREGYAFTTVTPATHARVLARRAGETACDLRDVFGWGLAFGPGLLSSGELGPPAAPPAAGGGGRGGLAKRRATCAMFSAGAWPSGQAFCRASCSTSCARAG